MCHMMQHELAIGKESAIFTVGSCHRISKSVICWREKDRILPSEGQKQCADGCQILLFATAAEEFLLLCYTGRVLQGGL
jgi:hypothetical protein